MFPSNVCLSRPSTQMKVTENLSILKIALPLTACGISALVLSIHVTRSIWRSWKRFDGHLSNKLRKTTRTRSSETSDQRKAQGLQDGQSLREYSTETFMPQAWVVSLPSKNDRITNLLQLFLVVSQICVQATFLWLGVWDSLIGAIVGLAVWIYITILVSSPMFVSTIYNQLVKPHRLCLLLLECFIAALLLRSSVLHSKVPPILILRSIDCFFASVLLLSELSRSSLSNTDFVSQKRTPAPLSPEDNASIFSKAIFGWVDRILWTGYYNGYEPSSLWDLPLSTKASTVLARYYDSHKKTKLIWRLLQYLLPSLLLQGFWAACTAIFTFAPVIILKLLLEYIEDPIHSSKNAAWFYVVLLLAFGFCKAVVEGQAFWLGQHLAVHLRVIVVNELFQKVLRGRMNSDLGKDAEKEGDQKKHRPQDSSAEVINLMSVDSFKIARITQCLHLLWASVPVELVLGIGLLYNILGYASIAGFGIMLLLLPFKISIARGFSKVQAQMMAATDSRIKGCNELFRNVRMIKYFVWEDRFLYDIDELRSIELQRLRTRFFYRTLLVVLYNTIPLFITFFSFLIFTVFEKRDLKPSVAFPALSLFALLRVPLDKVADTLANIQEAKVSIDRVEIYLQADRANQYDRLFATNEHSTDCLISLSNVHAAWPNNRSGTFRLRGLNVNFVSIGLNLVVGPTGSGKTALLLTLLKEMDISAGAVNVSNLKSDLSSNEIPPSFLSYCSQQAWLVNDSIRENITFGSDFDVKRYKDAVRACALNRDFETFKDGDHTIVGEMGNKLSGGQKQRIALARALYSGTRLVLLDDCLSSVDPQTATWVFENGICGPLMANRACILVTHNLELTIGRAKYVVVLRDGRIEFQGSPDRMPDSELTSIKAILTAVEKPRPQGSHKSKAVDDVSAEINSSEIVTGDADLDAESTSSLGISNSETRAKGRINWQLLYLYFGFMGPWYYWLIISILFFANQISTLAIDLWIRQWANAYNEVIIKPADDVLELPLPVQPSNTLPSTLSKYYPWQTSNLRSYLNTTVLWKHKINDQYYLLVYVFIAMVITLIKALRMGTLFVGSLSASKILHSKLLRALTRARFQFYDSTSLGQILNRLSRDMEVIDQELASVLLGYQHSAFSVLTILIIICVISPTFILPGLLILPVFFAIGKLYINTSRDLKRLESVQRSPLYQHFEESLNGVVTIRAYNHEKRFLDDARDKLDKHSQAYFYLWAANAWLAFRVDIMSSLIAFFAGAFIVFNEGNIDPGAAGLSLTYAITFADYMIWLVKLYGENEQNMVSWVSFLLMAILMLRVTGSRESRSLSMPHLKRQMKFQ